MKQIKSKKAKLIKKIMNDVENLIDKLDKKPLNFPIKKYGLTISKINSTNYKAVYNLDNSEIVYFIGGKTEAKEKLYKLADGYMIWDKGVLRQISEYKPLSKTIMSLKRPLSELVDSAMKSQRQYGKF